MVEPIAISLFQLLSKLVVLRLELEILDDEVLDRGGVVGRWERSAEEIEWKCDCGLTLGPHCARYPVSVYIW